MKKRRKYLTPAEEIALIEKKLGYVTFDVEADTWLDTGSKRLNRVTGSGEKGMPSGKMYEISGWESHGKTLVAMFLAGMAQRTKNALVGWGNFEQTFDKRFARKQGLDAEKAYIFNPKIAMSLRDAKRMANNPKSKRAKRWIQSAQEVCDVMEKWMELKHMENPRRPLFVVIDSVASLLVEEEAVAGMVDANMRTKLALASFMSMLCKRWTSCAANYNAWIVFINQLRMKPGGYGNPETTPGGKALRFYCSVRLKVRRVKDGRIRRAGKVIGLKGLIINQKNKAGEGSREGKEVGFKVNWLHPKWQFLKAEIMKSGDD